MSLSRSCRWTRLLTMAAVLAVIVSVPALAVENAWPSSSPDAVSLPPGDEVYTYGTVSPSALWLPAAAFRTHDSATTYTRASAGGGGTTRTGGTGNFWAEVNLPAGAVVSRVEIHHFDNSATNTGFHCFSRYNVDSAYALQETCVAFPAGTPGNTTFGFVPNPTISTFENRHPHVVHVFVDGNSPTYHFYGVRIVYRLAVSPAPATATFPNDVPTSHPFFRFVEAMAAAGITGGCGVGLYCPDQAVTRGQMAVFVSTALGLHFADAATIP